MTSRDDWLAQTSEEALEPELPICDAHHHFWASRPDPAHFVEALLWQERYIVRDLADDVSGHNVRSTVFMAVPSICVRLVRSSSPRGWPEKVRVAHTDP